MKQGVVVSDLHLFSRSSRAHELIDQIHEEVSRADLLVLNGDTFDFRWSVLSDIAETVMAARAFIDTMLHLHPHAQIHFVAGNHDCHMALLSPLSRLAKRNHRFFFHEYAFHLGSIVFLHGDCIHPTMRANGKNLYRNNWSHVRQRGITLGRMHEWFSRTGIPTSLIRLALPHEVAASRILSWLLDVSPQSIGDIRHIYFGHTHVPVNGFPFAGIQFHNTGSAVDGAHFNLLRFPIFDIDDCAD